MSFFPFSHVNTQVYQGLTAAARGIVAQHGVRGLYRGLGITMIEIVPYSALQFGLYDSLNTAYNRARVSSCQHLSQLHGIMGAAT